MAPSVTWLKLIIFETHKPQTVFLSFKLICPFKSGSRLLKVVIETAVKLINLVM